MRAAIYREFRQPFAVEEVPDPRVPDDGAVIRVEANGICRSDWHGWMGHDADVRLPHVPGHELAGTIQEVGPAVRGWRPGDRVTVPFSVGCGACVECASGNQQICDRYFQPGFTAWGSFAELVAIPHADLNLVRLPEAVGAVEAASLGCRFVTSFRAVVAQGRARPGEFVVVYGCGGVGLSAVMIARALGAQPLAVDIHDEALELARSLGAVHAVNARRVENVPAALRELTGGGAHLSLDALGSAATCRDSILSLRKRGRHVQVGLMVGDESRDAVPMDRVISRELTIVGSHGMQAHAYGPMLGMISGGMLRPELLIRRRISLDEAPAELEAMGDFRGTGVTVIDRF